MTHIELHDIVKTYRFLRERRGLKNMLVGRRDKNNDTHLVFDHLSFTIEAGDAVGFCGPNGCGKSTLLGLIGRTLYPDSGTVTVRGRVGMMLELCAGFCLDCTGRENILLNGVMQGATIQQMRKSEEEIIEFAGLKDFIDSPVFTYSSGMLARLGFAISIKIEAEILLIDEVLAVGDHEFQEKCFTEIGKLKKLGRTILFTSHDMGLMDRFCDKIYKVESSRLFPMK